MQIRTLLSTALAFFASGYIALSVTSDAHAQFFNQPPINVTTCESQNKKMLVGQTPSEGGQIIAYGPYTTRCGAKFHIGVLTLLDGPNVDLQLQRLVNGGWRAVATTHRIRYLADNKPGEWRWVVTNLGKEPATYRLEIVHPI